MAGQSWAPQSPDLSGYAGPQSPDLSPPYKVRLDQPQTTTPWAPQSPDIAGIVSYEQGYHQRPPHFSLDSGLEHKTRVGGSYPNHQPLHQIPTSTPGFYPDNMPTTRSQRLKEEDAEWMPHQDVKPVQITQENAAPLPRMDTTGIEVKTKFPVARIKRLMQADEDIGKVAQVTPVVMAKALELFMIRLITASSTVAKSRNSKRVMVQHMKTAVMQDEQFDNLREIVGKVPDAPAKKSGADSDDEDAEGPKKRKKSAAGGKGKKRRGSDDDF